MTSSDSSKSKGSSASGRHPELVGRIAIVTGGAQGIGQGIAVRLVDEGMRVVIADMNADALATAIDEFRAAGHDATSVIGFDGDLSQAETVDRLFETTIAEFAAPYLLVNNAADLRRQRVLDEHRELLELQLASNVTGPYLCSQRAAKAMVDASGVADDVADDHGVIVNLSSVGATRAHHRGLPYDMTKGAIEAMTRAMAVDLGPSGIRVNAVAPGVTRTHRSSKPADHPDVKALTDRIPLKRAGSVADIGATVAFLASDDAAYITGQTLFVDGGITAQLSPRGPYEF